MKIGLKVRRYVAVLEKKYLVDCWVLKKRVTVVCTLSLIILVCFAAWTVNGSLINDHVLSGLSIYSCVAIDRRRYEASLMVRQYKRSPALPNK